MKIDCVGFCYLKAKSHSVIALLMKTGLNNVVIVIPLTLCMMIHVLIRKRKIFVDYTIRNF